MRWSSMLTTALLVVAGMCPARAADAPSRSMEVIGSRAHNGDRTTFRDSSGRSAGAATQSGSRTTFRDSSGRSSGSATTTGRSK